MLPRVETLTYPTELWSLMDYLWTHGHMDSLCFEAALETIGPGPCFFELGIFAIVHLHSKLHRDQLGMTSNQANGSVLISPSGIIEPYKISTDPVPLCARLDDLRSLEQEMFEQVPKHFLLQTYWNWNMSFQSAFLMFALRWHIALLHEDTVMVQVCFFCEARKVVADLPAEPLLTHGCSVAVVLVSWALYPNMFKRCHARQWSCGWGG